MASHVIYVSPNKMLYLSFTKLTNSLLILCTSQLSFMYIVGTNSGASWARTEAVAPPRAKIKSLQDHTMLVP
jgi:hypothetical protein